ncbi:aldo/keto reductase [Sphingobium algorifonticola]|uniref:Aldo/keto reductase n=1 Tax=Sphingobium algorifonticola TaxID=2008318 RepID=A0A437J491_9SPHN|nr:aldo/keto reductase [Sphingobium algorifonticola]RVT39440.1 aldo/keto reductase [Sphingobium algorifonticola]
MFRPGRSEAIARPSALTALGFGAAPLGNLYRQISDSDADQAVAAAVAGGVGYFDVAPQYGRGLAEQRLGDALAKHDPEQRAILSTKVGILLRPDVDGGASSESIFKSSTGLIPHYDYSYDAVMASIEASKKRLGGRAINIVYAHDLGRRAHGERHEERMAAFLEGGYRALAELRSAGQIDAIGLGVNEWEVCEEVLAQADFDIMLLAGRYTLLEQSAAATFLPLCEQRGVDVVIGGPYNSGILAMGTRSGGVPYYDYRPADEAVIAKVAAIEAICDRHDVPLAAAALQFPLAAKPVVSVIPGFASAAELEQAIALVAWRIPYSFWHDLQDAGLIAPGVSIPHAPFGDPAAKDSLKQ